MTYAIDKTYKLKANQGDGRKAVTNYIILHETANPRSTGKDEASYMSRNSDSAYTQYIVGDGKVYQVGEPGYVAWGALDANPYSPVQIELQHTTDKALFKKNYAIYIELARNSAIKYGIPLTLDVGGAGNRGIKTHAWVTKVYGGDHTDPYGYLAIMGVSKDQLAKDLKNGIKGGVSVTGNTVRVKYSGKGKVRLLDEKGGNTDHFVAKETNWKVTGFTPYGVRIGKDQVLPYQYAKELVINNLKLIEKIV